MPPRRPPLAFALKNLVVWLAMVGILVVVPDQLERWVRIEVARVIGWAVACGLWVVVIEREWQQRVGPFTRFFVQLILWVGAALIAIWISDQARVVLD